MALLEEETVKGEGPDLRWRLKTVGSDPRVLDIPAKDASALRAQFCVSCLRLQVKRGSTQSYTIP